MFYYYDLQSRDNLEHFCDNYKAQTGKPNQQTSDVTGCIVWSDV